MSQTSSPRGHKRARSPEREVLIGFLHIKEDGTTERIDAIDMNDAIDKAFGEDHQAAIEDDRNSGHYRRLLVAADEHTMSDKPTVCSELLARYNITYPGEPTQAVIAAYGANPLFDVTMTKIERRAGRQRRRTQLDLDYSKVWDEITAKPKPEGEEKEDDPEENPEVIRIETEGDAIEKESEMSSEMLDLVSDSEDNWEESSEQHSEEEEEDSKEDEESKAKKAKEDSDSEPLEVSEDDDAEDRD